MSSEKTGQKQTRLRMSILACLSYVFLFFPFFFKPEAAVKRDIQIVLEQKQIEELSSAGLTINFLFKVTNSSSVEYQLLKTTTRVLVNQEEFFRVENNLEPPLTVPASASILVNVPVRITYAYLFQAIPSLATAESFICSLTGLFSFVDSRRRETKVPLAATAEFPLFREWEIRVDPLRVKSLTIGGAEVEVIVSFLNPNSSTWIMRRVAYQLELGGKEVAKGIINLEDSINPGEEKKLLVPLLIDFFETGEALASALEADETEVFVAGEMEIESAWGKFSLPFTCKQMVAVQKKAGEDKFYFSPPIFSTGKKLIFSFSKNWREH
ncbi:MAG: LEA type 2 family protein [Candidatus Aminicenantales bacterium]